MNRAFPQPFCRAGAPGRFHCKTLNSREFGWIATISKPRFHTRHQSKSMGRADQEPALSEHYFAIFDTSIGRCGIAWGPRGINAVQLPMGSEEKTRSRIRPRYADAAEAPPPAGVQRPVEGIAELLQGRPTDLSDVVLVVGGVRALQHAAYDSAQH